MTETTSAELDDGLLHATAGVCDVAYAWVNMALKSGLSDLAPEDVQQLTASIPGGLTALQATRVFQEFGDRLDMVVPASVLIHEETHFYQLISTPYGRLRGEIERYWLADLVSVTQEIAEGGAITPSLLPVRNWVERNLETRSPHQLLARFAELAYTQSHALACCLSGSPFLRFLGTE